MTATLPRKLAVLVDQLRSRDHDPAYADAPVLDAYGRISISIDGETEKVERQLYDVLRVILARGARLGEIHRDDNMSAWKRNGKRPGWRALMDRFETKTIDGAVAWHVDRLMRQPYDLERLLALADSGAVVATCFGEYQLDDADQRFILRILVAAACKASDDASRRQKRKHEAMRESGKFNGGNRAFGHQSPGDQQPVSAERLAAERDAIAWGVGALLDGASLGSIAAEWNRRGLTRVTGQPWHLTAVRGCIRLARHAGLIEHGDRIVGRMTDTAPIIDEDTFRALRAMLANRGRGRPVGVAHVLSGILRCALCGGRMGGSVRTARQADGELHTIYRCTPPGCGRNNIAGRAALAWAKAETLDALSSPDHARAIARRSAALARVESAIAAADADAESLAAKWGAGDMPFNRWEVATAALDVRLDKLRAERDALVADGADQLARPADRAALESDWENATVDQKRRMIRNAMPHGIGVEAAHRGVDPADRLFPISRG